MKRLTPRRFASVLFAMVGAVVASVLIGLAMGPSALSLGDVIAALATGGATDATLDIVWGIRMPRVVLALLVGASLATSGVVFQALLRNPLADPFVLGVSGGAALGGIAALSLGSVIGWGYESVPVAAFAGCLLTTALLYAIAGRGARVSATHLLLTGVVFNAFASAAIVFLASLAGMVEGSRIFLWLIGNLSVARIDLAAWIAVFLVLGLSIAWSRARSLDLLVLGDESAQQLGVDVTRDRRLLLLGTSLMVGAAVAAAGLVGFVGLIIPHLLRLVLGPDHRLLVPAAALGGAAFLVICDTAARTMLGGRELPVGAVTAIAGGPLFLYLLRRNYARVFAR